MIVHMYIHVCLCVSCDKTGPAASMQRQCSPAHFTRTRLGRDVLGNAACAASAPPAPGGGSAAAPSAPSTPFHRHLLHKCADNACRSALHVGSSSGKRAP